MTVTPALLLQLDLLLLLLTGYYRYCLTRSVSFSIVRTGGDDTSTFRDHHQLLQLLSSDLNKSLGAFLVGDSLFPLRLKVSLQG